MIYCIKFIKGSDCIKDKEYNKINHIAIFYTILISLFQFSDKLFGSTYVIKLDEQGFTVFEIGVLMAVSKLIILVFDYPSGVFADMIGRKKTAGIALILFGLGFFIWAQANSMFMYIVALLFLDIGISLESGSPQSWFYEILIKYKETSKREVFIPRATTVSHMFSIVAGVISIYLVSIDVLYPLYLGGIISIVAGIAYLMFYEDNKAENIYKINLRQMIKNNSKSFFYDKRMRSILVVEISSQIGFYMFILLWQLVLLNIFNVPNSFIPTMLIILMVALALGSYLTEVLAKKINLFKIFYLSKYLMAISFFVLFLSYNLYVTIIFLFIYDASLSMSRTSYNIWLNDYISSENRSSYMSMISS